MQTKYEKNFLVSFERRDPSIYSYATPSAHKFFFIHTSQKRPEIIPRLRKWLPIYIPHNFIFSGNQPLNDKATYSGRATFRLIPCTKGARPVFIINLVMVLAITKILTFKKNIGTKQLIQNWNSKKTI